MSMARPEPRRLRPGELREAHHLVREPHWCGVDAEPRA
jgi:hypothetical protein